MLRADGANWVASTLTMPDTAAVSTLLYASSANVLAALATANSGVLVTSGAGVPSIATDIPTAVTIGAAYVYRAGGTDVALLDGGLNASLTASNGGVFYSTATAGAILAGTATANQALLSGATAPPVWSTATYPATTTVSQILYSSSANVIAGLATANNAVLVTSGAGVPSISSTLPSAVQDLITRLGTIGVQFLVSTSAGGYAQSITNTDANGSGVAVTGGTAANDVILLNLFTATPTSVFSVRSGATGITSSLSLTLSGLAANTGDDVCRVVATNAITYSATGTCVASSEKVKSNIHPVETAVDILAKLEPIEFTFNNRPTILRYGLSAERTLKNVPRLSTGDSVYYIDIIPLLVKAIQEHEARLNTNYSTR